MDLSVEPIAIVGAWCRVPGASSPTDFWANLLAGRESITELQSERVIASGIPADVVNDTSYRRYRGVLEDAETFDVDQFGVTVREAQLTDPQHRQFLECVHLALCNAGHAPVPGERIGVFAAQSRNDYREAWLKELQSDSIAGFSADIFNAPGHLATGVAYQLGFTGPAIAVQTACSSSLVAVHMACQALRNDECHISIAGGVSIGWPQYVGYRYMPGSIMSHDGHCRPFDEAACGTVRGEGVGVVVLKRLADAMQARDSVLAVIRGSAVNNDGRIKPGFSAPALTGQVDVIRRALASSRLEPSAVGYVETHGTATAVGDAVELAALREAFGDSCAVKRWLGTVKANIGHLDAAAGVVGLIKAAFSVATGKVPPNLNFTAWHPELQSDAAGFRVTQAIADWHCDAPRTAGVSSFGLGGTNAHVILEASPAVQKSASSRPYQILLLGARSQEALNQLIPATVASLSSESVALDDAAFTLACGREHYPQRVALVAADVAAAKQAAGTALSQRPPYAHNARVAFSFRDSNMIAWDWIKAIHAAEPCFRATFAKCADMIFAATGVDISARLRGEPGLRGSDELGTFASHFALARTLIDFGLQPQSVSGAGLGECSAACVAGELSLEDTIDLIWAGLAPDPSTALEDWLSGLATTESATDRTRGVKAGDGSAHSVQWWLDVFTSRAAARDILAQTQNASGVLSLILSVAPVREAGWPPAAGLVFLGPGQLHSAEGHKDLCAVLGKLWEHGVEVDWRAYYSGERRWRVALPPPPLTKKRYVPPTAQSSVSAPERQPVASMPGLGCETRRAAETFHDLQSLENLVLTAMREVLQSESVNANDNFFEVGGYSLMTLDLIEQLNELTGTQVLLRTFLHNPSASKLAEVLYSRAQTPEPVLKEPAAVLRMHPGE